MASRPPLRVWWDGEHVADLTRRGPADLRLRYTDAAFDRWLANTPALSCSLPVAVGRLDARPFLMGLLPEGQHLQAAAATANVLTGDIYGMLARYGRDVAGALTITTEGVEPDPDRWDVEPYDDASLDQEVADLQAAPGLGIRDDSELSLPGLQNKLLVVALQDGGWGRPRFGRPSTHILKVEDPRFPGLAALEAEALGVARAIGLTTVSADVEERGGRPCLIVERYDRVLVDGTVRRIHQEDACQALGVDIWAHEGRAKYESRGGPSFRQIAALLEPFADDPRQELDRLAGVAVLTVAIGNADAHGKNLSLIHHRSGAISLAPLYDTVPTCLFPSLPGTAAMSINGRDRLDRVTLDDLIAEVKAWGVGAEAAVASVDGWYGRVAEAAVDCGGSRLGETLGRRLASMRRPRPGATPSSGPAAPSPGS